MREIVCEICGKKFETKAYNVKYCAECRVEVIRKKKAERKRKKCSNLQKRKCKICGAEFVASASAKYCSKECKSIGKKHEVVCEICGKKFETKTHNVKYCAECRVEINKKRTVENQKKNYERVRAYQKKYRNSLIEKICPTCGEKFAGTHRQKYCSRECKSIAAQKLYKAAEKKFRHFCEERRDDYLFYMREYFLKNHKKFIGNMHDYARCEMKKLMKKSVEK